MSSGQNNLNYMALFTIIEKVCMYNNGISCFKNLNVVNLCNTGPPHDKTYKMACAPSEDSDQPGHPPSLIRVFAVCMKKAWVLSYPLSAQ